MQPFSNLENIRKPYGFLMISGGRQRVIGNKWINMVSLLSQDFAKHVIVINPYVINPNKSE